MCFFVGWVGNSQPNMKAIPEIFGLLKARNPTYAAHWMASVALFSDG
jgi:hypothetical protein